MLKEMGSWVVSLFRSQASFRLAMTSGVARDAGL